ncbi:Peptidase, M23/M37 family protein [Ketogulonicigenium robustum]|uniref:Peptidase, M23/M37 family protein n=1 Tax=Ketogulonicigenium robustum TaxID=92947 RepID=A0A1W6P0E1_9RHOB|nr:M23 family metallopeptidase [Ketogulonicigenium robustum]ARO14914.1 Peptidase, M23/M37 family protein [Ketogulonicigenium robustum]
MRLPLRHRIHAALERRLPERRLFIRSDTQTRFIRLRPITQLIAIAGCSVLVGWSIVATAIVLMDAISAGNYRAQAERDKMLYEARLETLSGERDSRAVEAMAAQERFSAALAQVSQMQTQLLTLEDQRVELESGLDAVHQTLRRTVSERDSARAQSSNLTAQLNGTQDVVPGHTGEELVGTLDMLSTALAETAADRDGVAADAQSAITAAADLELELRLMQERNSEIFLQLEEAMQVSVEPLEQMFRAAGVNPDTIIAQVRRGYSGQGGPLTPLQYSTSGSAINPDIERANRILEGLDNINLYRIAADLLPVSQPYRNAARLSSTFGTRWNRAHEGVDFAMPIGSPIYATGEGVVTFAGWSSGYGRLIKIRHEFGFETRYAHLNDIKVRVGQRVSRGERIADSGNSGRSTGPHLHYEVRSNGAPQNPLTYIRAGRDVF